MEERERDGRVGEERGSEEERERDGRVGEERGIEEEKEGEGRRVGYDIKLLQMLWIHKLLTLPLGFAHFWHRA